MTDTPEEVSARLEQELRRGVIILATLSQLRSPQYGYSLRQALADSGMTIEEGTLYPLLRRLEGQGILASEWRIEEGPPRRYYTLSPQGEAMFASLTQSWRNLAAMLDGLIADGDTKKRKAAQ